MSPGAETGGGAAGEKPGARPLENAGTPEDRQAHTASATSGRTSDKGGGKRRRGFRAQAIIGALLGLSLFVYFIPEIFINVAAGEAGVLWRRFFGGTVTDRVYGEGIHLIFPWDEMHLYNVRVQERERTLSALTAEGLAANVLLSIRFHPDRDMVGILHKRVGPDYAAKIVIPEVEATVRTAIGKLTAEELYTTRYDIITRVVVEALEQVANNFVTVDDVIIRQVELPAAVREAIEQKVQQKYVADSFVFRILAAEREAQRKEIEAGGYARYNKIISESLNKDILMWEGVRATQALGESPNAKVVIMGNGDRDLPVILSTGN